MNEQLSQASEQTKEYSFTVSDFNKFETNLSNKNTNVVEAIKSVTHYQKSLDKEKVEFSINGLEKSTLFKPILTYYALMCLEQKEHIYIYDSSSEYSSQIDGSFATPGLIMIESYPISYAASVEVTSNLINLLFDNINGIDTAQIQNEIAGIILSHSGIKNKFDSASTIKNFFQFGLSGRDSGVLFHEITHRVIGKIFNNNPETAAPYFTEDKFSQEEYHQAICQTLSNIRTKFFPFYPTNSGNCQDLWKFGQELNIAFSGQDQNQDETDIIDFSKTIQDIGYFGKSIIGYSSLLSVFSSDLYSSDKLDTEFIASLTELDFYKAEDAIAKSIDGRKYYCQHVLPVVLDAIHSHPLVDQISFTPLEDFGCTQILGNSIDSQEL